MDVARQKKRRAVILCPRQFAPILDRADGLVVPVASVRQAWATMARALKLPGDGDAGTKLIRRSMATLVRDRIGEADYPQLARWLGHTETGRAITDIYALAQPAQLGRCLQAVKTIINEIEKRVPTAFHLENTEKPQQRTRKPYRKKAFASTI